MFLSSLTSFLDRLRPQATAPPRPHFEAVRRVQVAVATSSFCNARCVSCVWPYMDDSNRVMSEDEFGQLLDAFASYAFSELALNVINEPFVDRGVARKVRMLAQRRVPIEVLFFSSNWLLPSRARVRELAEAFRDCLESGGTRHVSVNATVSGIDAETYDLLQGGRQLDGAVAPYRSLDFDRAVGNLCWFVRQVESLGLDLGTPIRIKAYGELFSEADMGRFWEARLLREGVSEAFIRDRVQVLANHAYTSFARAGMHTGRGSRVCSSGFLQEKLTIGPAGELGLCCRDGLRSVVLGNLLESDLAAVTRSDAFQEHYRVVTGQAEAPLSHPCRRCEFYGPRSE